MDVLILLVLVLLLAGAFGPRAGWYGTAGVLWDVLSVILLLVLVVWLLRLLGLRI
jgi:hypothetical protein